VNDYDSATSTIGGWSTQSPSMGGTDPWVIAATTAVPEPSSLALAGLAVTCAIVLGGARNRMRFCRRPVVEAPAE
jgi:hypothetical protein